jgi:hypothetical protein
MQYTCIRVTRVALLTPETAPIGPRGTVRNPKQTPYGRYNTGMTLQSLMAHRCAVVHASDCCFFLLGTYDSNFIFLIGFEIYFKRSGQKKNKNRDRIAPERQVSNMLDLLLHTYIFFTNLAIYLTSA